MINSDETLNNLVAEDHSNIPHVPGQTDSLQIPSKQDCDPLAEENFPAQSRSDQSAGATADLLTERFKEACDRYYRSRRETSAALNEAIVSLYLLVVSAVDLKDPVHAGFLEKLIENKLNRKIKVRGQEPRKVFLLVSKASIAQGLEDKDASANSYANVFEALRNDQLDQDTAIAKLSKSSIAKISRDWREKKEGSGSGNAIVDDARLVASVENYLDGLPAIATFESKQFCNSGKRMTLGLLRHRTDENGDFVDVVRALPHMLPYLDQAVRKSFLKDKIDQSEFGPLFSVLRLAPQFLGPVPNLNIQIKTKEDGARISAWNWKRSTKIAKRLDAVISRPIDGLPCGESFLVDVESLHSISKLPNELVALSNWSVQRTDEEVLGEMQARYSLQGTFEDRIWSCDLRGGGAVGVRADLTEFKAIRDFAMAPIDWKPVHEALEGSSDGSIVLTFGANLIATANGQKIDLGCSPLVSNEKIDQEKSIVFPRNFGRPIQKMLHEMEAKQLLLEMGREDLAMSFDCVEALYRVFCTARVVENDI